MLQFLIDQANRALDTAVLWQLENMPVASAGEIGFESVDGAAFWRDSRIHHPATAEIVRDLGRRQGGNVQVVDVEAPSHGNGDHPGARKLLARAHLLDGDRSTPMVVILHGYAIPTALYEERYLRQLTRLGASAVRMDHPWHLRRRARGLRSGEGYMNANPARLRESVRQSVEDACALVAWARERSDHVAVLGVSLGGLAACLVAAHVEVDAMVAVAPFCDPATTVLDQLPIGFRRKLGLLSAIPDAPSEPTADIRRMVADAMAPIVVRNVAVPATPASRMALVRPSHDLIVGPGPITELAAAWGAQVWDLRHSHISVLASRGLQDRIYEWLLATHAGRSTTGVPLAG